jgi:hypothetical protein
MSREEVVRRGQLLTDYLDLKEKVATMEPEAKRLIELLESFAYELGASNKRIDWSQSRVDLSITLNGDEVRVTRDGSSHHDVNGKWPTAQELLAFRDEFKSSKKRLNEVTAELREFGIPVQ